MKRIPNFFTILGPLTNLITHLRLTTYIAIGVVVGLTWLLVEVTAPTFWQDYLSNALATVVGIFVGVPATLFVPSLQEKENERERKEKILNLLLGELTYNESLIRTWLSNKDWQDMVIRLQVDLKTETWETFSGGGEIQWIKDPVLLGYIADAFFSIKNVRRWSELGLSIYINKSNGKPFIEEKISSSLALINRAAHHIEKDLQ